MQYLIFGVALLVVVMLMLSAPTVVPYIRPSNSLNEYVYEGLQNNDKITESIKTLVQFDWKDDKANKKTGEELKAMVVMSDAKGTSETFTMNDVLLKLSKFNAEEDSPGHKLIKKVKDEIEKGTTLYRIKLEEGFANLDSYTTETVDVFSLATSSPTCKSGLTNTTGSLCLTDNMMKMLQTRGGNASGADSQIGSA